jgi:hypothetical protein
MLRYSDVKATFTRKPEGGWCIKATRHNQKGDIVQVVKWRGNPQWVLLGEKIHGSFGVHCFEIRHSFSSDEELDEFIVTVQERLKAQQARHKLKQSLTLIPGGLSESVAA